MSARGGTTRAGSARVVVYSRAECHLCLEAEAVVARVCAEVGERWERVDVDADAALVRRFDHEVPVTFVDGEQHDYWQVDPVRLRRALDGR